MQGKALQDFVIDKIDDLKGQDIVAIDVHGKSSITDCMIICTGTSTRHVMSIADHVVQESRAAGMLPLGVEGGSRRRLDRRRPRRRDGPRHAGREPSSVRAGKTLELMREVAAGGRWHQNAGLGTDRL